MEQSLKSRNSGPVAVVRAAPPPLRASPSPVNLVVSAAGVAVEAALARKGTLHFLSRHEELRPRS